tara:strand:- start:13067 stop:13837 length:771 start_codon:yes stop_codon:yes gene_type:complete
MIKVSFIGSGNVASHLAKGFYAKGITVHQVFSRLQENADILAKKVEAEGISDLNDLEIDSVQLVVVSVKDDVLKSVSDAVVSGTTIIVHTSGTVAIEVLAKHKNHGVFYPLQTFSKSKEMDLSNIPFCIEASNKNTRNKLIDFASILSTDVRNIDSNTRKSIHLAAVFACNFSNHMLTIADSLLAHSGQDISLLNPLINETIRKALASKPASVQTGPAARGDSAVIESHLERLASKPQLQRIYKEITESIINWENE